MMIFDKLFAKSIHDRGSYREWGLGVYGDKALLTLGVYDVYDRSFGLNMNVSLDTPSLFVSVQIWKKCYMLTINDEFIWEESAK